MRTFRHWKPIYIYNRLNEIVYQYVFPNHPWLTKSANQILMSLLKETDIGLEFGSGRSTIWFGQRISFLTSVEHNASWFSKTQETIAKQGMNNIDLLLCLEQPELVNEYETDYVRIINKFDSQCLDFVLVDGIYRSACANSVLDKIKPGGLLIVDNVNWFLPSNSFSPASRKIGDSPISLDWSRFLAATNSWRHIWTTSGVTDTAFYFKPCL